MEYSAIKSKEILTHTTTWMDFQNIMYAKWKKPDIEVHILHNSRYRMFRTDTFMKTENRLMVSSGCGWACSFFLKWSTYSGITWWWWLQSFVNILKSLNCRLHMGNLMVCELYLNTAIFLKKRKLHSRAQAGALWHMKKYQYWWLQNDLSNSTICCLWSDIAF